MYTNERAIAIPFGTHYKEAYIPSNEGLAGI